MSLFEFQEMIQAFFKYSPHRSLNLTTERTSLSCRIQPNPQVPVEWKIKSVHEIYSFICSQINCNKTKPLVLVNELSANT